MKSGQEFLIYRKLNYIECVVGACCSEWIRLSFKFQDFFANFQFAKLRFIHPCVYMRKRDKFSLGIGDLSRKNSTYSNWTCQCEWHVMENTTSVWNIVLQNPIFRSGVSLSLCFGSTCQDVFSPFGIFSDDILPVQSELCLAVKPTEQITLV